MEASIARMSTEVIAPTAENDCWRPMFYGSGTTTVQQYDHNEPYLYIYGPGNSDTERMAMCQQLADWMNGGTFPLWLNDMDRVSEIELIGSDKSSITACGPLYDADPPNLDWRTRQDDESKGKRAKLIDRLWFARKA